MYEIERCQYPSVPLYFDIATNIYVYSQYDLPYTGK